MTVFWVTLVIVFTFSLLARYFPRTIYRAETEIIEYKPNVVLSGVALLVLVMVAGLRSGIGDTETYIASYTVMQRGFEGILETKDWGFNILQVLLKNISEEPQIFIFTTAMITNTFIFSVIYNYAGIFELGSYLYITTGCYLVSMNGIRQYLASAVLFVSIRLLLDGNWKKYFIIVLIASTIHQSALIMIPIYFIVRREAWSKGTLIIMGISVIAFLMFVSFTPVALALLDNTQYGNYKDSLLTSDMGANPIRLIISMVPLVLSFIKRDELKRSWPQSGYIVNMSMMNSLIMLFATYNWIFARFCIYFELCNLILLPSVVKVYKGKDKAFMYYMLIVCYFVFYYYDQVIALNISYPSKYLNSLFRL